MAIPDEDVARVRAATDLAALVGEHSSLKRVGRRLTGLCPFHQERSPSFSINPEEGLYYCFGCGASGDAISFVRAMDGISFLEAVERLAARAGIAIRRDGADSAAARADQLRRQAMLDATSAAVAFYHERLLHHGDAGAARQYLRSRGYDGEVVRRFVLGWAPAARDELARSLGAPLARALRETGLAHESGGGRLQDSFRGRVIFPIFDTSGRPIALGGRILPGADPAAGPKYRNSPESPVYSKRRTLYGLNWAKTELQHVPEVVVCEGYTDVIGFHLAGVPRAVATCGTALTDEHLKTLGSFAKRVVLAFDADKAGQSAASRIYESERRHQIEVAVAALPPDSDPADLARTDPEALRVAVKGAAPFLAFRLERAMAAEDLRAPEGRARAADAALAVVAEHPNDLVRDQYLVQVADRCRIEPDRLRSRLETLRQQPAGARPPVVDRPDTGGDEGRRGGAAPAARPDGPSGRVPGFRVERRALALAVHRPAEIAPYLREGLFAQDEHRRAFRALLAATSLHAAIDTAESDTADLLRQLAVSEPQDDLDGAVLALARVAADRLRAQLDAASRAADRGGDLARVREMDMRLTELRRALEELRPDDETARAEDAAPLLAWLTRGSEEEL